MSMKGRVVPKSGAISPQQEGWIYDGKMKFGILSKQII
jgi:hypothetical protein